MRAAGKLVVLGRRAGHRPSVVCRGWFGKGTPPTTSGGACSAGGEGTATAPAPNAAAAAGAEVAEGEEGDEEDEYEYIEVDAEEEEDGEEYVYFEVDDDELEAAGDAGEAAPAAPAAAAPAPPAKASRAKAAPVPFQKELRSIVSAMPSRPAAAGLSATAVPAAPAAPLGPPPAERSGGGLALVLLLLAGVREARAVSGADSADTDPRKRGMPRSIAAAIPGVAPQAAPETEEERAAREAEEARAAEAAAKKREDRRAKEEREEKKKEAERQKYVDKEKERVRADRVAREKREAEAAEAIRKEEEARAELEKKIRAENREKRRLEEIERKQQEEERKAQREAEEKEIAAKLEAERQARAEAERKMRKHHSVKLVGQVKVRRPQAAKSDAAVEVEVTCGSTYAAVLGMGQEEAVVRQFASLAALREAGGQVVRDACEVGAKAHGGAVRMQQYTGSPSPLDHMKNEELEHWMRVARVRAESRALAALEEACRDFESGGGGGAVPFEQATERSTMPGEHRLSTQSKQEAIQDTFYVGNIGGARRLLQEMVAEEEEMASVGGGLMAHVLTYSHVLDHAYKQRDSQPDDVEEWRDQAAVFERSRSVCIAALREAALVCKEDIGLDAVKAAEADTQSMLGTKHPCAVVLRDVVEQFEPKVDEAGRPLSKLAEEMAWPTRAEIAAAAAEKKKKNQPIPEQVWALKNVALTLSRSADTRGQARGMLEEALLLKEGYLGGPLHPGLLADMEPLASVLEMAPEWKEDASEMRARMLEVVAAAAEEEAAGGDPARAAVLLEAGMSQLGPSLGREHPAIVEAAARVAALLDEMGPEGREAVLAARESPEDVVMALARDSELVIDTRKNTRRKGL